MARNTKTRTNNNRNKSFRRNDKSTTSVKKSVSPVVTGDYDNDPGWYKVNGQMTKDVATFPSSYDISKPVVQWHTAGLKINGDASSATPGILALDVLPGIGETGDWNATLNVAASQLYQAVQAATSRTPSYDASELMMYFIAVSNAYACYQWLCRLYGTSRTFAMTNRYLPRTLVEAQGFDYDRLTENYANFRTELNLLAIQLGSLYLPKSIDYTSRCAFLYEGIYADSEDIYSSQLYLFRPTGFYKWIEGDKEQPLTHLNLVPVSGVRGTTGWNWNIGLNYLRDLLTALRNSEDVNMINSDLLRAFGKGSNYEVYPISETFSVQPVYNPEVLSQIENAYIMPNVSWAVGSAISPVVSGQITYNPAINGGNITASYAYTHDSTAGFSSDYGTEVCKLSNKDEYMINFHHNDPGEDNVLVATRLSHVPDWESGTSGQIKIKQIYGTEAIVGAHIFVAADNDSVATLPVHSLMIWSGADGGPSLASLKHTGHYSSFDWAPNVTEGFYASNALNIYRESMDWNVYVLISREEMKRLDRNCLVGLFTPKTLNNIIQMG